MENTWTGNMTQNILNTTDYPSTLIILAIICYLIWKKLFKKKNQKQKNVEYTQNDELKKAYQRKWLFTYNEKDAYKKLKTIAEKYGYTVFAKVRLFDLVEPIKGNPKYRTFLYKIQAKHVDFVLADEKLVAQYVIELDDNSHNNTKRAERDKFVDTVLENTGYKILHTKVIDEEQILTLISKPKTKNEVR